MHNPETNLDNPFDFRRLVFSAWGLFSRLFCVMLGIFALLCMALLGMFSLSVLGVALAAIASLLPNPALRLKIGVVALVMHGLDPLLFHAFGLEWQYPWTGFSVYLIGIVSMSAQAWMQKKTG